MKHLSNYVNSPNFKTKMGKNTNGEYIVYKVVQIIKVSNIFFLVGRNELSGDYDKFTVTVIMPEFIPKRIHQTHTGS